MMRNLTALVLAGLLVVWSAGCGGKDKDQKKGGGSSQGESANDGAGSPEKAAPPMAGLPTAIEGVKIGMSIEEVEKVLGRPKDMTMTQQGDKAIAVHRYVKGEREMVVMFDDGKVMTAHQGGKGGGDEPTKDSPLLGAKFGKVKTGMSADEVLKLLGTPANQTGQGNMMTYQWRDAKAEYVIIFVNNKVQTMHQASRGGDE